MMRTLMKPNAWRLWFPSSPFIFSSNSNNIKNIRRNINNISSSNKNNYDRIIKFPLLSSLDNQDEQWPSDSDSNKIQIGADFSSSPGSAGATVLRGKIIAEDIRSKVGSEIRQMKESVGEVPGLAAILVGQRPVSQSYLRNKRITCEEVGIKFELTQLPENCTTEQVCNAVSYFNKDPSIHGILVQLPLPKFKNKRRTMSRTSPKNRHIAIPKAVLQLLTKDLEQHLDEVKILDEVCLDKDVDGFHPLNIGSLALCRKEPLFIPCTPKGCVELLLRYNVKLMGKHVVMIGRSNIVGLPLSLILQRHHATVSILDVFSSNPEKISREADILIVAAGVPILVRSSWLKPGVVVVDVGTNPIEDPSEKYGYRLTGDVCYEEATSIASAISPVPGGVGPMTVAMLLLNTPESAKRTFNLT